MTSTTEIVRFLGDAVERLVNMRDVRVSGVGSMAAAKQDDLAFFSTTGPNAVEALTGIQASVVICSADLLSDPHGRWPENVTYVGVRRPRLEFARIHQRFFAAPIEFAIHETAVIGRDCDIQETVSIGPHTTLGNDVSIGKGTRIGSGVFVAGGTRIGEDCNIQANVVIGEAGFGFERDGSGRAVPFPHVARVVIGDRVLIGANSCIARGALSDTVIEDDVQIDTHVHVAHNVHIHRNATIVAHSSISGSAEIEEGAWLSPGTLVMGGITIGAGAKVGVGSVVTKTVAKHVTVFGNPARTVWTSK
jgi:UDP-3-O-[3-hydroxymyristoyl] glucosamine N-acyltransferase